MGANLPNSVFARSTMVSSRRVTGGDGFAAKKKWDARAQGPCRVWAAPTDFTGSGRRPVSLFQHHGTAVVQEHPAFDMEAHGARQRAAFQFATDTD